MANRKCALCPWVGQLRRGWCEKHYQRWKAHGDPLYERPRATVCAVEDCRRTLPEPGGARGWCQKHYVRWKKHGDPEATASCKGCGGPIVMGKGYTFCMRNPDCRRQARIEKEAREDPEVRRLRNARWRAANPDKVRASEARYKARADRTCGRAGCSEFALPLGIYCHEHRLEAGRRYYERKRLKLPLKLYERQSGLCPDAAHGGCGLPFAKVDGNNVDHIIPRARGGPDDEWNLQLMHPWCNARKLDHLVPAALILAAEHGVALRQPKRQAA